MVLPVVVSVLGQAILTEAASQLAVTLVQSSFSFGYSLLNNSGKSDSGLGEIIQQDSRYQEAITTYFEQETPSIQQQQQAQQKFNQNVLELVSEWQSNGNNNKLREVQNNWDKDNWFSKLDRQETEQILGQSKHQLLILSSIPEISPDCPSSFEHNLKTEIRNGIKTFINQYFDTTSYPIAFYGDYFKNSISDIDVKVRFVA